MDRERKLRELRGNQEEYHIENTEALRKSPIRGKHLCFLGSSVTAGDASLGVSFADYIVKRNGCTCVKEAVGGTTLADENESSYIRRMQKNIRAQEAFDAFICQLSTNDASQNKPMGRIAVGKSREGFDTSTVIGALEYIIEYAQRTWKCPVIFYTGTRFDSGQYEEMIAALYQLREKWGIGIIDLWHDEAMNAVSKEEYALYMADPIHPTQAGYREWWTPVMEAYLYREIADGREAAAL